MAFITTKGTLDKSNPTIRKYLAERSELIGAIRLPNTAFKDNAGTEVTSDIIFLQKREKKIDIEPDWVHLGYTEDGIAVNSYFVEHPEMILGRMQYDTRIYGQDSRYTVCVNDDPNFNMYEALNKAISNMQAELTDFERLTEEEEKSEDIIPADPDVRNFSYCFVDGKLYFRENSQMVRREVSATVEERIKALDEIRTVTRHLIDIQTEGCSEEELADVQRLLNERYDRFVDKYGSINSQGNSRAFRDDSDYPLLCSLEEIDEDGNVKKADMFYKQTIKASIINYIISEEDLIKNHSFKIINFFHDLLDKQKLLMYNQIGVRGVLLNCENTDIKDAEIIFEMIEECQLDWVVIGGGEHISIGQRRYEKFVNKINNKSNWTPISL